MRALAPRLLGDDSWMVRSRQSGCSCSSTTINARSLGMLPQLSHRKWSRSQACVDEKRVWASHVGQCPNEARIASGGSGGWRRGRQRFPP
jgi:hypothetical protein